MTFQFTTIGDFPSDGWKKFRHSDDDVENRGGGGGDPAHLRVCHQCQGSVRLSRDDAGKRFLVKCNGDDCGSDMQLPLAVKSVDITDKKCTTCFPEKAWLVTVTFNTSAMNREFPEMAEIRSLCGCLWCEGRLKAVLREMGFGRMKPKPDVPKPSRGGRQGGRGKPSRGGRRNWRGRGGRGGGGRSKKSSSTSGPSMVSATGHSIG